MKLIKSLGVDGAYKWHAFGMKVHLFCTPHNFRRFQKTQFGTILVLLYSGDPPLWLLRDCTAHSQMWLPGHFLLCSGQTFVRIPKNEFQSRYELCPRVLYIAIYFSFQKSLVFRLLQHNNTNNCVFQLENVLIAH